MSGVGDGLVTGPDVPWDHPVTVDDLAGDREVEPHPAAANSFPGEPEVEVK